MSPTSPASDDLRSRRLMVRLLVALSVLALIGFFIAEPLISLGWDSNTWSGSDNMFYHLFATYDRWQLLGFVVMAALFAIILRQPPQNPMQLRSLCISVPWLALAVLILTIAGTHLVMMNYPFAMDEFFSDFQAAIFAKGHLWAATPSPLSQVVHAATPYMTSYQPETQSWTSNYLPVYALLRVPFYLANATWLLNPLLAAGSILAIAAVAKKLWPESTGTPFVSAFLLATSSQFLINSMTAYAMPAHVFFNLLWLLCYLRNDRAGFWLTPWIGVAALGLHQPNIHFVFVVPFILRMLTSRQWSRAFYSLTIYAAGCLFWLRFIQWKAVDTHLTPLTSQTHELWFAPFLAIFRLPSLEHLFDHLIGLTQILAWNSCLLVLLASLGLFCLKKCPPTIADLVSGMILALDLFLLFPENQGHGWGNRYFYSSIASFVLVATAGWQHFHSDLSPMQISKLVRLSLAGFCVQFATQAMEARQVVEPFANASRYLHSRPIETVVIDTNRIWYGQDLVRNNPGLDHKPTVLFLRRLDKDSIQSLDARNSYEVYRYPELKAFGLTPRIVPLKKKWQR